MPPAWWLLPAVLLGAAGWGAATASVRIFTASLSAILVDAENISVAIFR